MTQNDLDTLRQDYRAALRDASGLADLDRVERAFLGRHGRIKQFYSELPTLEVDARKQRGSALNALRAELQTVTEERRRALSETRRPQQGLTDITLPGIRPTPGALHPLMAFQERIEDIFLSMGYEVVRGPEVEWSSYNFDLLNVPKDHPSRDAWDTFYIDAPKARGGDELLLRTQTSPVQIRAMEKRRPPVRLIAPGRVFRHEATDASHEATFYQIEGLVIDQGIRVTDLIGTVEAFLRTLFGREMRFRIRPHFYPFTEPSMDIELRWKGEWLEMAGSGMVHPKVLENMKVDPSRFSGFAFGMGPERLMMLYYGIHDIRLSYAGDVRFSQALG